MSTSFKRLIRAEWGRWFNKTSTFVCFFIIILISIASALASLSSVSRYLQYQEIAHLSYANITSFSSVTQFLLIDDSRWTNLYLILLPFLVLVPMCHSLLLEAKSAYVEQVYTRINPKDQLKAKLVVNTAIVLFMTIAPLVLNFVALSCVWPYFRPLLDNSLAVNVRSMNCLAALFYAKPILYLIIMSVMHIFALVIWSNIVLLCSTLFRKSYEVVLVPGILALLLLNVIDVADLKLPVFIITLIDPLNPANISMPLNVLSLVVYAMFTCLLYCYQLRRLRRRGFFLVNTKDH